jgi:hypothetical protein
MKVFVATCDTQGGSDDDLMEAVEGELVWMVEPCPLSRRYPDGPCVCGVTFTGMFSSGVTSTAAVRDIAGLTRADYEAALEACHDNRPECTCPWNSQRMADSLLHRASRWPTGTVVSRRLDVVSARRMPSPA